MSGFDFGYRGYEEATCRVCGDSYESGTGGAPRVCRWCFEQIERARASGLTDFCADCDASTVLCRTTGSGWRKSRRVFIDGVVMPDGRTCCAACRKAARARRVERAELERDGQCGLFAEDGAARTHAGLDAPRVLPVELQPVQAGLF